MLRPHPGVVLPRLWWERSPNYSQRHSAITLVVVHDTEGAYDGAIRWFANPASRVSAHLVLSENGRHATQMVHYYAKAWQCEAFNSCAIGLEMAGFAGKGYPDAQLRSAARIVAYLCHRFQLPARYVGEHVARQGFTFHQDLGVAGGGHHDPGLHGLRKRAFINLVRYEARRGGFDREFGQ